MSKTPSTRQDRYIVPGLVRGLQVLQAFTPDAPRQGPADLARRLGTTRSALFRVLYTLTELGCLLHDPRTGLYAPGPAVLQLGQGAVPARRLLTAAWPELQALRDATGWSAHLGLLDGTEVVYLLRAPAVRGRTGLVRVGTRLPAHATAMGRVLLAALPEAEIARLCAEAPARPHGAGGAVSLPALLRRARLDRARGHVVHLGEFQAGMASLAAPLRDDRGRVVAAINITAELASAGEARRATLLRQVLGSAEAISRRAHAEER
jgi:DNA-binding IclR family transcriptional regulator